MTGALGVNRLWDDVVGQEAAAEALQHAAKSPVHAYLLVGPEGSGKRAASRAFTADLLVSAQSAGTEVEALYKQVGSDSHPAVTIVERDGIKISALQAREVVRQASLAPKFGDRQVFVLDEFHRVSDAAPILLKSIEEPNDHTVFVVLAEEVPDELVTIASRCVRVDLSAVPTAAIRQSLEADGVSAEISELAAASAGGNLRRARLLASDDALSERQRLWQEAPNRLDGTGASICAAADELLASIEDVLKPLSDSHAQEIEAFEEQSERLGGYQKGERKRLESRHKREVRRVGTDELRSGIGSLIDSYRESDLTPGDSQSFLKAADAAQEASDSLVFNPNEALALRALLARLPTR